MQVNIWIRSSVRKLGTEEYNKIIMSLSFLFGHRSSFRCWMGTTGTMKTADFGDSVIHISRLTNKGWVITTGWNTLWVQSRISRQLNSSPLLSFCFIQPFVSLSFPLWRHRLRYTLLQLSTHTYTQTCTQATERRGGGKK